MNILPYVTVNYISVKENCVHQEYLKFSNLSSLKFKIWIDRKIILQLTRINKWSVYRNMNFLWGYLKAGVRRKP